MICTCDNCHCIFQSEAVPKRCPECGMEGITHHVLGMEIPAEAVREAYPVEKGWFYIAQWNQAKTTQ